RTAFRAFLRGRAVVCTVPPEGGRDLITAECRVGNQDVGQWLIENGWARAAKGGPYVEAGDKARMARKGIFGPAPSLSGLPPTPAPLRPRRSRFSIRRRRLRRQPIRRLRRQLTGQRPLNERAGFCYAVERGEGT
ncbi:thermonuclease family protein, partial [Mesorhizobium sp.]|uniref:thermonuclease family protein n=1 Tax=Mesorhizobium sp. TaxID=1871066 RepID=UPI00345C10A3